MRWNFIRIFSNRSLRGVPAAGALSDWKREALDDFTRWLAEVPESEDSAAPPNAASPYGLADVAEALSALRTDTSALARHAAKIIRDNEELLAKAAEEREETGRSLASIQKQIRADSAGRDRAARVESLLFLFDIADDLRRLLERQRRRKPARRLFFFAERASGGVEEDLELLIRRMDDALLHWNVRPVAAAGKPFDPQTMRALSVTEDGDVAPGCVREVVRQGVAIDDRTVRIAQVNVEREKT